MPLRELHGVTIPQVSGDDGASLPSPPRPIPCSGKGLPRSPITDAVTPETVPVAIRATRHPLGDVIRVLITLDDGPLSIPPRTTVFPATGGKDEDTAIETRCFLLCSMRLRSGVGEVLPHVLRHNTPVIDGLFP